MVYDCRKTFKFLKSLVTLPHDVFILICYCQKRWCHSCDAEQKWTCFRRRRPRCDRLMYHSRSWA